MTFVGIALGMSAVCQLEGVSPLATCEESSSADLAFSGVFQSGVHPN